MLTLPDEIRNKIFTYLSHPIADIIRPWIVKYKRFRYKHGINFRSFIMHPDYYAGWWWYSANFKTLVKEEFLIYLADFYDF